MLWNINGSISLHEDMYKPKPCFFSAYNPRVIPQSIDQNIYIPLNDGQSIELEKERSIGDGSFGNIDVVRRVNDTTKVTIPAINTLDASIRKNKCYVLKRIDWSTDELLDEKPVTYFRDVHFLKMINQLYVSRSNECICPYYYHDWITETYVPPKSINSHNESVLKKTGHILLELFDSDMMDYKAIESPKKMGHAYSRFMKSDMKQAKRICRDLSSLGIVHGDIKMDQFLIFDDEVIITDFGLSGDFKTFMPLVGSWMLDHVNTSNVSGKKFHQIMRTMWDPFLDDIDMIVKWFNYWQLEFNFFDGGMNDNRPVRLYQPNGLFSRLGRFKKIPDEARELFSCIFEHFADKLLLNENKTIYSV